MTKASIAPDSNLYFYDRFYDGGRGRVGTYDPCGPSENMPKAPHFVMTVADPQESLTQAFGRLSGFLKTIDGATGALLLCKTFARNTELETELLKQNPLVKAVYTSPDDSLSSGAHNCLFQKSGIKNQQNYLTSICARFEDDFRPLTV